MTDNGVVGSRSEDSSGLMQEVKTQKKQTAKLQHKATGCLFSVAFFSGLNLLLSLLIGGKGRGKQNIWVFKEN